jgi:hypothetical protein
MFLSAQHDREFPLCCGPAQWVFASFVRPLFLAEFEDDFDTQDAPTVFYSRALTLFGPVALAWAARNSRT